jgi:hypothetical protein
MSEEEISIHEFRAAVSVEAHILEVAGFRRAPNLEHETPTTISIVYIGQNVAFVFEYDIRDQGIDLVVMRYLAGKLMPTCEGGYSSSLLSHLIEHCGFRGRPQQSEQLPKTATRARRVLSKLVGLLQLPCAANLLSDQVICQVK